MITIWKFPVRTRYNLIFQTRNEEAFVYIKNIFFIWEFSRFNICKNVLILKWKLSTKFVTLYLFMDLPAKLKTTLKLSLKIWIEFRKYSPEDPFLVVAIGDFNAKSSKWHIHDKWTCEGNEIDNITSQLGLHQVIKEPTDILDTSSLSIDLICTSLPNLIIDSGVQPPRRPKLSPLDSTS